MKGKRMALLAMALAFPLASQAETQGGTASCRIVGAHYHLSSRPEVGLSFVKVGKRDGWMSDLALRLTPASGPAYGFLFDEGSARYINLISTTDVSAPNWHPPTDTQGERPLGEMHYFAWSGDYRFESTLPTSATPAPERVFLPDLAEALWYRAQPRVGLEHGVFLRDRCG